MSEERFPGDLLESRPSSTKVALGVAGIVVGLGALVCGGVAGYVALTTTAPAVVEPAAPPTEDPANIREVARKIITIDIPEGFEPVSSEHNPYMNTVVFGRKGVDGASLMLAGANLSQIPASTNPLENYPRLLGMLDREDRRGAVRIKVDAKSQSSTREFTVLGLPTSFQFIDGTLADSEIPVRKVSGAFRSQKAYLGLVYVIPTADYDEEAFQKMIESIRPAIGDSPVDANATEDSAEKEPQGSGGAPSKTKASDADNPNGATQPDQE